MRVSLQSSEFPGLGGVLGLVVRAGVVVGLAMTPAALGQACVGGFERGDGFPGLGSPSVSRQSTPVSSAAVGWDPDGDGPMPEMLVIAGAFSSVDGVPARGVAMWDGRQWRAMGAGLTETSPSGSDGLRALAVHNGEVYAAGNFRIEPNDATYAWRVAKWNGTTWTQAGATLNGEITSLASFAGDLYVGGRFTVTGGGNLAKLTGSTWTGFGPNVPGAVEYSSSRVDSLTVQGDSLLVGGLFSQYVIRQDAAGVRRPVGPALAQFYSGSVTSILASGQDVYIAGTFRLANNTTPGVEHWDGTAWTAMPAPSGSGPYRLGGLGSSIYLSAGPNAGGGNLLTWDGATWVRAGTAEHFNSVTSVVPLCVQDNYLVIGGSFNDIAPDDYPTGFIRRQYSLARLNPEGYILPISRGLGGQVAGLAEFQGKNIAVGRFVTIGTTGHGPESPGTPGHVAEMGEDGFWKPFSGGLPDNNIWGVANYSGQLVIGGEAFNVGGLTNATVAAWDGSTWHDMSAGAPNGCFRLISNGSELWGAIATGAYISGPTQLGRWNGSAWDVYETGWPYEMRVGFVKVGSALYANDPRSGGILRLTASGPQPLSKPEFETSILGIGEFLGDLIGLSARRVYRWNGTAWSRAGDLPSTLPTFDSVGGSIDADGVMYAGLAAPNNLFNAGYVITWDGSAWGYAASLTVFPAFARNGVYGYENAPLLDARNEHEVLVGGVFRANRFVVSSPATTNDAAAYAGRIITPGRAVTLEAPPADLVRDARGSVDLTWRLSDSVTSYAWTLNGTSLTDGVVPGVGVVSGATTEHLQIEQLEPGATGKYQRMAADSCGNRLYLSPTYVFVNPPCDPDLNGDGVVDGGDVDYLITVVAGGDNPQNIDPDFNHDGNADQTDVDALLNSISGGGCP